MKNQAIILLLVSILALGGCSNAKQKLGLNKKAPDEFSVVKRAPLAMPPDFALRPPMPGAQRPQEQTTVNEARQTVFGAETAAAAPQAASASSGDSLLLQQAGATNADPSIRQKVDAEREEYRDYNKPVARRLFGIGGDSDAASATVVNQAEEAARIRNNTELGKPVTEGETPYVEQ